MLLAVGDLQATSNAQTNAQLRWDCFFGQWSHCAAQWLCMGVCQAAREPWRHTAVTLLNVAAPPACHMAFHQQCHILAAQLVSYTL